MATSGKLAELYVDLIANDKLGPAIQNAKDIISRTQSELSQISTVAGQQRLKEFVTTNKQMAAEQEKLRRTMDIAINGRFNVFMKDMRDGINKAAEALAGFGMGPLGTAIAGLGVMNAMQQASPDIWNTFTGSVNYAAAGLGTALMPMLIELSQWLQGVARWFLNLDDGTKAMIGGFVKWAAIIGVVGFALSKIIGIIQGVSKALQLLALANPWLLLAAGVGVLLGIAGASMASGGESSESYRGMRGRGGRVRDSDLRGLFTLEERDHIATTVGYAERVGAEERGRASLLDSTRDERSRTLERRLREVSAIEDTRAGPGEEGARSRRIRELMREASGGEDVVGGLGMGEIGRISSGRGTPADIARAIELAVERPTERRLSRADALERVAREGPRGRDGGLLNNVNFQSQFMGIEQQWKSLQQAGASMSPLQTEMMRIQLDQLQRLAEISGYTSATTLHVSRLPSPPTPGS